MENSRTKKNAEPYHRVLKAAPTDRVGGALENGWFSTAQRDGKKATAQSRKESDIRRL